MASRMLHYTLHLAERPQFERLVDFVREVESYADREVFLDLKEIVDQLREDLIAPKGE